jgi:hypothetical protein
MAGTSERVRGLIKSFENALVYTTVLRNIDNLVQNKDDSILIMILASGIASVVVVLLEQQFKLAQSAYFGDNPIFLNVAELLEFLIERIGDIVVQLTSSLSATLAISVFSSADNIMWGLSGALLSLSLLWMIEQVVTKKT